MARGFWTDDKVDILKKLVEEGATFSHIGARIGCSKNAAIGKALRIGVQSKYATGAGRRTKEEKGIVLNPRKVQLTPPRPKREKPPAEPVSPPVYEPERTLASGRIRIQLPPELHDDEAFELRIYEIISKVKYRDIYNIPDSRHCKWIDGDPKSDDARWCRMDVAPGHHYCYRHVKLCYEPRATGGHFRMPKYPQLRK